MIVVQSVAIFNDFQNPLYFLPGQCQSHGAADAVQLPEPVLNQWNLLFTNILLITIPPLIMYIFFNRQIVAGMTAGASRGDLPVRTSSPELRRDRAVEPRELVVGDESRQRLVQAQRRSRQASRLADQGIRRARGRVGPAPRATPPRRSRAGSRESGQRPWSGTSGRGTARRWWARAARPAAHAACTAECRKQEVVAALVGLHAGSTRRRGRPELGRREPGAPRPGPAVG